MGNSLYGFTDTNIVPAYVCERREIIKNKDY